MQSRSAFFVCCLLVVIVMIASCGSDIGDVEEELYEEYQHDSEQGEATDEADRQDFSTEQGEATDEADGQDFSTDATYLVERFGLTSAQFLDQGRLPANFEEYSANFLLETAEPMTRTEFVLAVKRLLATIDEGHLARSFNTLCEDGNFSVVFQDGGFTDSHFIARPYGLFLADENYVITNYEVTSIGGVPIDEILDIIDLHYGRYNEFGRLRNHGRYARSELMLRLAGADIDRPDGRRLVDIGLLCHSSGSTSSLTVGFTPLHPSRYRSVGFQQPYIIRHEQMGDVLYISMRSTFTHHPEFQAVERAITNALDDGIRKFILDLRFLPGGTPDAIHQLADAMGVILPSKGIILRLNDHLRETAVPVVRDLPQFVNLPDSAFEVDGYLFIPPNMDIIANEHDIVIVALTSADTFSAGVQYAAIIADSGFGYIIGEPSATSPSNYGFNYHINLPLARIIVRASYTIELRADTTADQVVLWPDIWAAPWEAIDVALDFLSDYEG